MPNLYFTTLTEANTLLGEDPFALLVGLTLYQQVPTEKAFAGPYLLRERLGGELDAAALARLDPEDLKSVFREKPALHRFPASMAKRVQSVAQFLVEHYSGDASAVWGDVTTGDELLARLASIPGFGEYKARLTIGVLAAHFGIRPTGYEDHLPDWPSIVDIESPGDLADLKERKKAWKAARAKVTS